MPVLSAVAAPFACIVLLTVFLLYRRALPKPIPGIPYDKRSANRLLGDVPDALRHVGQTKEMGSFLLKRCIELDSPVVQIFAKPFQQPWVVVADGREAQDVMARRTREFDRSEFMKSLFITLIPHEQVSMDTNDRWRANRKLVADVMSSDFLNNKAAPSVYQATQTLVDLWREKMRLADGQAFDACKDINMCTIDTIFAAVFGSEVGACKSQRDFLMKVAQLDGPKDAEKLAWIPTYQTPKDFDAIVNMISSAIIPMHSPLGQTHHWLATKLYPSLRQAIAHKNRFVGAYIEAAWQKVSTAKDNDHEMLIKSAVDLVVEREVTLAKKEGRKPEYDSVYVRDELTGFLTAGYETTASTLNWGLKYLTAYPAVQSKLRAALRQAFTSHIGSNGQPHHEALAKIQVPYLEACVNEILRYNGSVAANTRKATVDTQILGYHIPKGTDVFFPTRGPSYLSPPVPIEENKRSQTSRESREDERRWASHADLDVFRPERWLVTNSTGEVDFDGRAAPLHNFGAGLRSCYGKKLAYLEMRVIYTLILWNFELAPIPEALAGMKGQDVLTYQPQTVYVSLREAKAA